MSMFYRPQHLKFDAKAAMRRFRVQVVVLTMVMLLGLVGVGAVMAGSGGEKANPHFVGVPTLSTSADGTVSSTFKVAGLDNLDVTAELSGDAQCVNRGNNEPQAENKDEVFASETLQADKNGNLVATLFGATTLECPDRMTTTFQNVKLSVAGLTFTF